jgi:RNA polymerase sigma factor (sigma-70 family)
MASAAPEIPLLARDQAFEALYRRYVKDVYHYALALLRNPADAEDVTQTTFMNAYRAYKRGDVILKPQNWLIKIAHNVARTRYARASRRVTEVPLEEHLDQLAVPEDERPSVEGVLRALGRLPFNQRAAILMRELEGRSYLEIADTLGVSVAAVETLIFRARKSLRLRASALRAMSAVPLPGSLAHLLEGGGAAAGGGALIGSSFLAKTAAVLVVGVVATGIGGGKTGPGAAVAKPDARVAAAADESTGRRLVAGHGSAQSVVARWGKTRQPRQAPGAVRDATDRSGAFDRPEPERPASGRPAPATSGTSTQPTEQVGATAHTAVGEVVETASTATGSLPLQAPSLPPVEVEVPPPPVSLP